MSGSSNLNPYDETPLGEAAVAEWKAAVDKWQELRDQILLLREKVSNLPKWKDQIEKLREKLNESTSENADLIEASERKNGELEAKLKKANKEVATLQGRVKAYGNTDARNTSLTQQLEEALKNIEELKAKLAKAAEELESAKAYYEEELDMLRGQIAALKKQLKKLQAEKNSLEKKNR